MKWDVQETKKILVRTKKRFMDYFLGELNRFEQDCRVDTVDAYTIASKNFDLERQNILHALSIAAEEGHESYRKVCLTGSYLMRTYMWRKNGRIIKDHAECFRLFMLTCIFSMLFLVLRRRLHSRR